VLGTVVDNFALAYYSFENPIATNIQKLNMAKFKHPDTYVSPNVKCLHIKVALLTESTADIFTESSNFHHLLLNHSFLFHNHKKSQMQ